MIFRETSLANPEGLNDCLFDRFTELSAAGRLRQTHFFGGRFENTYIEEAAIPEIAGVLDFVRQQAGALLGMAPGQLKTGFWFNAMQHGQRTLPHHHDENDELLSAVYYIRVPGDSGDLLLYDGDRKVTIRPAEGKLVMFAPATPHEVTVNNSMELRLAVAVNIGPASQVLPAAVRRMA